MFAILILNAILKERKILNHSFYFPFHCSMFIGSNLVCITGQMLRQGFIFVYIIDTVLYVR